MKDAKHTVTRDHLQLLPLTTEQLRQLCNFVCGVEDDDHVPAIEIISYIQLLAHVCPESHLWTEHDHNELLRCVKLLIAGLCDYASRIESGEVHQ